MRNLIHRRRRHKLCRHHRCYLTLEDACHDLLLLAHSPLRALGPEESNQLDVYRCPHCHEFHVGHIPASVRNTYKLD